MTDEQWRSVRRILAVRLDNLGDVLVTTPALHAIKRSLPQATLTLLASPVGAQVARMNPDLDDVVVHEAPWMDPWHTLPQDSVREQRMIETIRAGRYDGAIIFTSYHQSPLPAAYLCYLADIPLRMAASTDGPGSLLTTRHKHRERMMHEVERGLDLVGAIGMGTDECDLVLRVPEVAREEAAQAVGGRRAGRPAIEIAPKGLRPQSPPSRTREGAAQTGEGATRNGEGAPRTGQGAARTAPLPAPSEPLPALAESPPARPRDAAPGRRLVVVHPGCSMPARTYPWEQYAGVVDLLVEQLGARVVLTGAEDERVLVERIYARLRPSTRAATLALAGQLSFAGLCALIESADLTITNNTGPMHISAAVKTPVVALFALTNPPEQWGPWHVPHRQLYHEVTCRLCYSRVCPYEHDCLRLVTPQMVVDAAHDLLEECVYATDGHASMADQAARAAATASDVGSNLSAPHPHAAGRSRAS